MYLAKDVVLQLLSRHNQHFLNNIEVAALSGPLVQYPLSQPRKAVHPQLIALLAGGAEATVADERRMPEMPEAAEWASIGYLWPDLASTVARSGLFTRYSELVQFGRNFHQLLLLRMTMHDMNFCVSTKANTVKAHSIGKSKAAQRARPHSKTEPWGKVSSIVPSIVKQSLASFENKQLQEE